MSVSLKNRFLIRKRREKNLGESWTYQEGAPFVANKRTLGTIRTEQRALYIRSKKKKKTGERKREIKKKVYMLHS